MNDLINLIKKGESQSLEFKKSFAEQKEILQSICAFSNTNDGKILVGVSDEGEPLGTQIGKNTLERIPQKIRESFDSVVFPLLIVEKIEGKNIVVIDVSEAPEKPVFFKDNAYKRVGRANRKASASEIRKLAKESGEKVYWDEQVCKEVSLTDIDRKAVKWFLKKAKRERNLNIDPETPIEEVFESLKLIKEGRITNAAALLFSMEQEFLQSEVKCIRFSGNDAVKPYIDFQTLTGNVFDLIDRAEDFVLRNIKKSIWLVSGQVEREEKYEYHPDAVREAIVNAVVHRDYESPSKVQVRVFDNRIEIWSPGELPKGITLKDLKRKHRSIPRNPLLFKQLFWVKYVEDVGGGTLDMIRWCKEWQLPEPDFEFITGAMVVVFNLPPPVEDLEKLGLNDRQLKSVSYVVKKGSITNKEYQDINNVARTTTTKDLSDLVKKGVFVRVGSGKRDMKYVLGFAH